MNLRTRKVRVALGGIALFMVLMPFVGSTHDIVLMEVVGAMLVAVVFFPGVLQPRGTTASKPRQCTFDARGIAMREADAESHTQWAAVVGAQRAKGYRFLFINRRQAFVIPDRMLTPADSETLDILIAVHVLTSD